MATFTTITAGMDWQDVDFINEMVTTLREHQSVAGVSLTDEVGAGDDIQSVAFWNGIQTSLEAICTSYITSTTPPDFENLGTEEIPIWFPVDWTLFTLAAWRTEAGIHADGFRRATEWIPGADDGTWENDVDFSPGKMQAGDIIGPWLFDDIQKGLDALNYVKRTPNLSSSGKSGDSEAGTYYTKQDAIDAGETDFNAASYNTVSTYYRVWREVLNYGGPPAEWSADGSVADWTPTAAFDPTPDFAWTLYIDYVNTFGYDPDSKGWNEDEWVSLETGDETDVSGGNLTGTLVDALNTYPCIGMSASNREEVSRIRTSRFIISPEWSYTL